MSKLYTYSTLSATGLGSETILTYKEVPVRSEGEENKPIGSPNRSSESGELPQARPGQPRPESEPEIEALRERWDLEGDGLEVEDDGGHPEIRTLFGSDFDEDEDGE